MSCYVCMYPAFARWVFLMFTTTTWAFNDSVDLHRFIDNSKLYVGVTFNMAYSVSLHNYSEGLHVMAFEIFKFVEFSFSIRFYFVTKNCGFKESKFKCPHMFTFIFLFLKRVGQFQEMKIFFLFSFSHTHIIVKSHVTGRQWKRS